MVVGSEGFDETGWKPELFKAHSIIPLPCGGGGGGGGGGVEMQWVGWKEIKSQTRTILETIYTLYNLIQSTWSWSRMNNF